MKVLQVIALSSGLGSAIGLAWILAGVIRYGKFTIVEPNIAWLYCEMGLVILSAICCFVSLCFIYKNMVLRRSK